MNFGLGALLAGPLIMFVFIGIFVLIFGLVFSSILRNSLLRSRLQKQGIPGTAKLIRADGTGVSTNDNPQMKLTLAVTGQDGQSWEAVVRQIVPQSQLYAMAPGTQFNVLYDPTDRSKVVLDTRPQNSPAPLSGASVSANGAAPVASAPAPQYSASPADVAAIAQAYQQLIAKQDAVQVRLANATLAPAKVLTYTQIAVSTNQQDPVATLLLEVQPEHGQPFTGQVNVGIQASRVDHFAPGCTIYVRYDPTNLSEVALFGSEKPYSGF